MRWWGPLHCDRIADIRQTLDASWNAIVIALETIGHKVLADRLRVKYHVSQTAGTQLS